jgi:tripartite-type tricarboxylate transporter receptor subunit TctC
MAAEFPSKPVTLIVPWTAGSTSDIVARVLAQTTSKHLGQSVIVENKPGGGGILGPATMAATAKPDGYTITEMPGGVFRYPHMIKVTYDPFKDFSYIIHLTGYTFAVVVKADSPWKTWNEFLAYAKTNPGKITYATTGTTSKAYTTMEMLAQKEGIKWTNIPMKGSSEVGPAVLGGHVAAGAGPPAFAPLVKSGELRMLVTWGEERAGNWPDIPTLKELGHGIVTNSPYGLAGPKGMDPKIVKILHDAFKKGMYDPAYQKSLDKFDQLLMYKNSEEYADFAKILYEQEKMVVERLDLKQK